MLESGEIHPQSAQKILRRKYDNSFTLRDL
jgi:hypothetical protein